MIYFEIRARKFWLGSCKPDKGALQCQLSESAQAHCSQPNTAVWNRDHFMLQSRLSKHISSFFLPKTDFRRSPEALRKAPVRLVTCVYFISKYFCVNLNQ